jgi:hypothetical protein
MVSVSANQNLTILMNNLNQLSQKTTFDSVVNRHLRSTQQQNSDLLRRSMQPPASTTSASSKATGLAQ